MHIWFFFYQINNRIPIQQQNFTIVCYFMQNILNLSGSLLYIKGVKEQYLQNIDPAVIVWRSIVVPHTSDHMEYLKQLKLLIKSIQWDSNLLWIVLLAY